MWECAEHTPPWCVPDVQGGRFLIVSCIHLGCRTLSDQSQNGITRIHTRACAIREDFSFTPRPRRRARPPSSNAAFTSVYQWIKSRLLLVRQRGVTACLGIASGSQSLGSKRESSPFEFKRHRAANRWHHFVSPIRNEQIPPKSRQLLSNDRPSFAPADGFMARGSAKPEPSRPQVSALG
jgi:hypothetical protein